MPGRLAATRAAAAAAAAAAHNAHDNDNGRPEAQTTATSAPSTNMTAPASTTSTVPTLPTASDVAMASSRSLPSQPPPPVSHSSVAASPASADFQQREALSILGAMNAGTAAPRAGGRKRRADETKENSGAVGGPLSNVRLPFPITQAPAAPIMTAAPVSQDGVAGKGTRGGKRAKQTHGQSATDATPAAFPIPHPSLLAQTAAMMKGSGLGGVPHLPMMPTPATSLSSAATGMPSSDDSKGLAINAAAAVAAAKAAAAANSKGGSNSTLGSGTMPALATTIAQTPTAAKLPDGSGQGTTQRGMSGVNNIGMGLSNSSAIPSPSGLPNFVPMSPAMAMHAALPPPQPFITSEGLFMSEQDPFGTETPSHIKFASFEQLDEFIKLLSIRNGFRHVLRRSHKDEKGNYKHGTYVCEYHASPSDLPLQSDKPARASSKSIRLSCPYKINFARQGESGVFHVNKRIMQHSHILDPSSQMPVPMPIMPIQNFNAGMGMNMTSGQNGVMTSPATMSTQAAGSSSASALSGMKGESLNAGTMGMNGMAFPPLAHGMMMSMPMGPTPFMPPLRHSLMQTLLNTETAAELAKPVTEMQNPLSVACDQLDSAEFLRALRSSDGQLFNGFRSFPSIFDESCVDAASRVIDALVSVLRAPREESIVVLGGAGTSGRLAWFIANQFNAALAQISPDNHKAPLFHSLCAGGERALLLSESTLPEDDADLGRRDLQVAIKGKKNVIYIGMTCGMSAPYVAGQLDVCLELGQTLSSLPSSASAPSIHTVLIGCSPASRSRDDVIERWHEGGNSLPRKTFQQIAKRMESMASSQSQHSPASSSSCTVLTPVVGPEFITGSTRMKGGSVTKMLLEGMISTAVATVYPHVRLHGFGQAESSVVSSQTTRDLYLHCLQSYERTFRQTYMHIQPLSRLLDAAAASLSPPMPGAAQAASSLSSSLPPSSAATASPAVTTSSASAHSAAAVSSRSGRIFYLGFSPSLAQVAFIDASEMQDTFGAGYEHVRAFIKGGLRGSVCQPEKLLADKSGIDGASNSAALSTAHLFDVSLTTFKNTILPTLTAHDTVIALVDGEEADAATPVGPSTEDQHWTTENSMELLQSVHDKQPNFGIIHFTTAAAAAAAAAVSHPLIHTLQQRKKMDLFNTVLNVPLSSGGLLTSGSDRGLTSFSIKLLLNAISTGAHVRNGFVLGNRMINLSVCNTKLFARAIALITELTQVSMEVAERQLLRAIYQVDQVTDVIRSQPISSHASRASQLNGVVPLALFLADCEASRYPLGFDQLGASGAAAAAVAAGAHHPPLSPSAPAITIQQAMTQLQHRTFNSIMKVKYGRSASNNELSTQRKGGSGMIPSPYPFGAIEPPTAPTTPPAGSAQAPTSAIMDQ